MVGSLAVRGGERSDDPAVDRITCRRLSNDRRLSKTRRARGDFGGVLESLERRLVVRPSSLVMILSSLKPLRNSVVAVGSGRDGVKNTETSFRAQLMRERQWSSCLAAPRPCLRRRRCNRGARCQRLSLEKLTIAPPGRSRPAAERRTNVRSRSVCSGTYRRGHTEVTIRKSCHERRRPAVCTLHVDPFELLSAVLTGKQGVDAPVVWLQSPRRRISCPRHR